MVEGKELEDQTVRQLGGMKEGWTAFEDENWTRVFDRMKELECSSFDAMLIICSDSWR